MPCEFFGLLHDGEVRVIRVLFGKTRTKMGLRAGILTQIMPRLHSITDKFRVGTL
jgi:hypothetical protein